ncbi:MAG TPA: TIGR00266 family protein [Thermoanaerobaculia bacterium]|nr:TIGR00266 family protein [Thermoanaerobaculia bacterium]
MANGEQWYMVIGGHQVGPVSADEIAANLKNGSIDSGTLVYTHGMETWAPISSVPRFAAAPGGGTAPAAPAVPGRVSHDIDFQIFGTEMQFVEVELDPGESAIAEAGVLMYLTRGIEMETVFGDGSAASAQGDILGALLGAGKRILTGESLFMTIFTNRAGNRQRVAFAAPYAGKILPMDLGKLGGQLICQKDSFLCAAKGIGVEIAFQKRLGAGLFGGEGFILQRLLGDGLAFVHAGGTVHALDLAPGEDLRVDTGCLVAFQPTVSYDIEFVGKVKTALFGGEGIFFVRLTGPGRVWLQSLPLSRLADRIYKAAPRQGGGRREEGSVLDQALGLGDLLDGR